VFGWRQDEVLREVREIREDLREDRHAHREFVEAHRQFTAELTLQLRRIADQHSADMREIREEMRAGRQALLAILDRLPPPGESTA
jgi:hypothetical protein